MGIESTVRSIEADDFARRFSMRAGNLMWLLGAGASASAGVPTAWDMTWEFRQQLYVSQRRVSPESVQDLSNPAVRSQLRSYIEASENFPPYGAADEYAALFEAAWPNEGDRRTYIDGKLSGAKPSYGHVALATLMQAKLTKMVWTTNFDTLVADACAKVFDSTGALTTVARDAPDVATEVINAQRWPVEVKLHGDFRSRRLMNTSSELRQLDAQLRQIFKRSCMQAGLVVAGYSGRDASIMDALDDVLEESEPLPAGLFWLHRGDSDPLPRVSSLLQKASDRKIDGGLVRIENFDETLRDITRLVEGLDESSLSAFASERKWWTPPAKIGGKKGFPVIRLNALPFTLSPTVCRRVVCDIGGYSEIRAAIEKAERSILFGRVRAGVLAFGTDSDIRAIFDPFNVSDFDLHPIETRRLRYDSGERGLLRSAISCALSREHKLTHVRHRTTDLLTPTDPEDKAWERLKQLVGPLCGSVSGHKELRWREGIGTRIDWADERLWLLFEPRTVFEGINEQNRFVASDFSRERSVKRYNRQLNDLIGFWASTLAKDGCDLHALGIASGVDAVFRLSAETAFSRRASA